MKKLLLALLLFCLIPGISCPQSKETAALSNITSLMAVKISYLCQYNERMGWLFATANRFTYMYEADRILETLDKHKEYAERFIHALYYNFGVEMSYWTLKNADFTVHEIDVAEKIWRDEEARRDSIAEQRRMKKERKIMERIEAGDSFIPKELSVQPQINIDLTAISMLISDNLQDEAWDYWYRCIVRKDGHVSLENPLDTLKYTDMQRTIYTSFIEGDNALEVGRVTVGGKQIPVDSRIIIQINEVREKNRHNLEALIRKDRRSGLWHVLWGTYPCDLERLRCRSVRALKSGLMGALFNCPELKRLKGEKRIEVAVYERTLKCDFSEEVELPYAFEISLQEDGVTTGLEYDTSLMPENAFEEQDMAYIERCNKIEKEYAKHPERFVDVSLRDGDFPYYVSRDGFAYDFAGESFLVSLLEEEGVYMLFSEQRFVKRKQ